MGAYFKPWRRKIGVLSLLLACVLMVAWMRSWNRGDVYVIRIGDDTLHCFISQRDWIGWVKIQSQQSLPRTVRTGWDVKLLNGADALFNAIHTKWFAPITRHDPLHATPGYFGVSYEPFVPNPHLIMPYWSIVIPLTLLSAYLLLSKPRKESTTSHASVS